MTWDQEKRKYAVLALSFLITFGMTGVVIHLMSEDSFESKINPGTEIIAEKTPEMVVEESFHQYLSIPEHYKDGTKALLPSTALISDPQKKEVDLKVMVVVPVKDDWGKRHRQAQLSAEIGKWAGYLFSKQPHFVLKSLEIEALYAHKNVSKMKPALKVLLRREEWEKSEAAAPGTLKGIALSFFPAP